VTGKREPGAKYLRAIGELYDVKAIKMLRDPDEFGLEIADPARLHRAEENIAAHRRGRLKAV
jgi:hypothetical protein